MSVDCSFQDLIFSIFPFLIIILEAKWPNFVRGRSELFFRGALPLGPGLVTALSKEGKNSHVLNKQRWYRS